MSYPLLALCRERLRPEPKQGRQELWLLGARPKPRPVPVDFMATMKKLISYISGCDFALGFSALLIYLDSGYVQVWALQVLVLVPEEASF